MPTLSGLWNAANTSLIPEAPVRKLQESMTEPHLDESPWWAQVKGFGAGALEGLRNQITPANLAMLALPGGGAARGGAEAAEAGVGAARAAAPTMDLIESSPWQSVRQVAPTMGDVDALAGGLKDTLARIPNGTRSAVQSLRDLYPSAVHDSQSIKDIARPGTQQMMGQMYEEANPALQKLRQAGQMGGERTIGDLTPSMYRR
jgi:hypothetical protein